MPMDNLSPQARRLYERLKSQLTEAERVELTVAQLERRLIPRPNNRWSVQDLTGTWWENLELWQAAAYLRYDGTAKSFLFRWSAP